MTEVYRQTALCRVFAFILLRPGSALSWRPRLTPALVPASPNLAQPLHIAIMDGEQPKHSAADAALR